MLAIHTILYPTDFSANATPAFRLACALARDYGAKLILLNVVEPPIVAYGEQVFHQPEKYLEELRQKLQSLEVPTGVKVERLLVEGDPVTEILAQAKSSACDLICLGTHGRSGIGRLLVGSVAEMVLRKAPCPVVTVKPAAILPGEENPAAKK